MLSLGKRHVLQDKTNGEGSDLTGIGNPVIKNAQTVVSTTIIDLILNQPLIANNDKYNQREANRETGEYIHTFILKETGEKIQIIYLGNDNTKVKLIYAGNEYVVSGDNFEKLKPKLKAIYNTPPVYLTNPDGTLRGAWVDVDLKKV